VGFASAVDEARDTLVLFEFGVRPRLDDSANEFFSKNLYGV